MFTAPAPLREAVPIFPVKVTFPVSDPLLISRLVRALEASAPIFPVIVTAALPEEISRLCAPKTEDPNSIFPAPVPEDNTTSAPRVIGAFISISPVVVMLFEIVKALLVATIVWLFIEMRVEKRQVHMRMLIVLAVLIVGLAPGLRDIGRLTLDV